MARTRSRDRGASRSIHVHAHLDVFVDGKQVVVPGGIGIDIDESRACTAVRSTGYPAYGGINQPCASRASRRCTRTTRRA